MAAERNKGGFNEKIRQPLDICHKTIYNFLCWEQLSEIASKIKKRLATGGSARGGEILVQGDRREELRTLLADMGYKVKG